MLTSSEVPAARPRHGGNLVWAARLAGCPPASILDFSASIVPLEPPAGAIAAMQRALGELGHYPDPSYRTLRAAIAARHGIDPEWVLPGNGAAELLTWAARELAACDAAIAFAPAFGDYARALQAFAARPRWQPLPVGTPEFADAVRVPLPEVTCDRSRGVLLNNPHNPTGKLFAASEVGDRLGACGLAAIDEAFMEFLPPEQDESAIALALGRPNLVVIRSLTKFYGVPGVRLGYAIAHPDRLRRWQEWRDPWPVNALAAAAGAAMVADREFQQRVYRWLPPARAQLFAGLAALPGLQPLAGAANFLLVRYSGSVLALQEQLLRQEQLLIRHCTTFPELGDAYFRVAVRAPDENERLLAALGRVLS